MANPTTFTFDPVEQTFTFSNGHLTIVADTSFVVPTPPATTPESVTVDTVSLTTPHDTFTLPVHDVVVPPPVVEHVFDLLFPHT
jgi:hypothetical protein